MWVTKDVLIHCIERSKENWNYHFKLASNGTYEVVIVKCLYTVRFESILVSFWIWNIIYKEILPPEYLWSGRYQVGSYRFTVLQS
jgi:hypothetical protein